MSVFKFSSFFVITVLCLIMTSGCGTFHNCPTSVNYLSIRQKYAQPTQEQPIPADAKILVVYSISEDGKLTAIVYNRTSEIMTIDQTQSFFVDTNGKSTSYYDPTVRTTSTTDLSSTTKGASVNLGAIAGVFGVGGIAGQIANGINVNTAGSSGTSVTNATYISDQPLVHLAPNSNGAMSKTFKVSFDFLNNSNEVIMPSIAQENSPWRFSVCISYSFDGGKTIEKLVTEFYAESYINAPLKTEGKVSEAMTTIVKNKPDMYNVPLYILDFRNNYKVVKRYMAGVIYDYQ